MSKYQISISSVVLTIFENSSNNSLTLFDIGFFETSVMGGGHELPDHNFVDTVPMIMKFGTGIKLD